MKIENDLTDDLSSPRVNKYKILIISRCQWIILRLLIQGITPQNNPLRDANGLISYILN